MSTADEVRARIAEKTNRIVALGLELNHSLPTSGPSNCGACDGEHNP